MERAKTLGKALERLRLEASLPLEELAQQAGIRADRLAAYEAGVSEPRWATVERLLLALKTGPGALGQALEEVAGQSLDESHPIAASLRYHQEVAGLLQEVLEKWPERMERRRAKKPESDVEGEP